MKKNKKLTIIVFSLLAVIGVSLAYFTVSMLISGNGAVVDGTTATIQGSTVTVEGTLEFNDLDIYPGHQNVSSIRVTATGNNELIPYNVIWEGTNTLNTPLNYTIYKTTNEIEVSASCNDVVDVIGGSRIYYEECTITNLDSLGEAIGRGTIESNTSKVTLAKDEFITSTSDGTVVYYYVVLEYPNLDEPQNSDIGGSFSGEVTIEESSTEPDINIIAAYIEQEDGSYAETTDIPQSGYTLNTERSTCSNGAVPSWQNNGLFLSNLTKSGISCYLYFDEAIFLSEAILADKDIQERTDFSTVLSTNTSGIIYHETTSDGTTYYFAGNTDENWMYFANRYWRIIRINEDGSIRMIYNGIADQTGTTTQYTTSAFNGSYTNNMYVGYMYTSNQVHGLGTDSTIKGVIDGWYEANILDTEYEQYISTEAGFCGDRTSTTSSSGAPNDTGGTGGTVTYYGAYYRLYTNKTPTFKCDDEENDLYTVDASSKGNHALDYPVGLITADEVAYAGGVWAINNSGYYLYTNQYYWTMSPFSCFGNAEVFRVNLNGELEHEAVFGTFGVRPFINLDSDVTIVSGDGTSSNPYRVL